MNADLEEIRARAFQLWLEAGKPEGRDEEFWHQAERQLLEKPESAELEIPTQTVVLESLEDFAKSWKIGSAAS